MKNITSTLTKQEAALVIRDRAATYVEEHGADHTLDEFEPWAEALSGDVGSELDRGYLADVLFSMEKMQELENGTHPALRVNRAGTVDNTRQLSDWENDLMTRSIKLSLNTEYGKRAA